MGLESVRLRADTRPWVVAARILWRSCGLRSEQDWGIVGEGERGRVIDGDNVSEKRDGVVIQC